MTQENPFDAEDTDADPFDDAQPSATVDLREHKGKLMLVWGKEFKDSVKTKHGEKEAVTVDVAIVKPDGTGELFKGAMFFQGRLIGRLRTRIGGKPILGRVIQVPTDKGNPAWDLDEPTEKDKAAARKYLSK